jgi:hypothetical protein
MRRPIVARCMAYQRQVGAALLIVLALGPLSVPARALAITPTLSGRLVNQNGRPVNADVAVSYYPTATDIVTVRTSDHVPCVTQRSGRRGCGNLTVDTATSWRDGTWRLLMPANSAVALPGLHSVDVTEYTATPSTRAIPTPYSGSHRQLHWSGSPISLGTHVLWTPDQAVQRDDAGNVHLHLKRPPGASAPSLRLFDQTPELIWNTQADTNDDITLDHHILESGTSAFKAFTVGGPWLYSAPMAALAGDKTPVSRGVRCSTYDLMNRLIPIDPCPFVDGDLGRPITPDRVYPKQACLERCPGGAALVIDLGAVRLIDTVVWRRCAGCHLDLSLDSSFWQAWPGQTQEGDEFAVLFGNVFPTRYVRVHLTPTATSSLREVSVWEHPILN